MSNQNILGYLIFKKDGIVDVEEVENYNLTSAEKSSFILSSRYILYAMNRLDWMYEFVNEAEKYGIDIKSISSLTKNSKEKKTPIGSKLPELRVIHGDKKKSED